MKGSKRGKTRVGSSKARKERDAAEFIAQYDKKRAPPDAPSPRKPAPKRLAVSKQVPSPCSSCGLPQPLFHGPDSAALVVFADGSPVANAALEALPRDERWMMLGHAADALCLTWWDRMSLVTAELVTHHHRTVDRLARSRLGISSATPEEIEQMETTLPVTRALARLLQAMKLAAGLRDTDCLEALGETAGTYLRKHEDVEGHEPNATTTPEYYYGGDVPAPLRRGAVAKAAYELACEAALCLARNTEPDKVPSYVADTLASAPRRRAITYASIMTDLPSDLGADLLRQTLCVEISARCAGRQQANRQLPGPLECAQVNGMAPMWRSA